MSDQNPPVPPQAPYPGPQGTESVGTAPAKKSKKTQFIIYGVLVAVVAVLGIIGWVANRNSVENAKVGDCVKGVSAGEGVQSAEGVKIVKCDDTAATHKVVGTIEGKTYADFQATEVEVMCQAYPTTTYEIYFGEEGKKGQVLCLEDAK